MRNISSFVQQNELEKYLEHRAAKRPKVAIGSSIAAASSSTVSTVGKATTKGVGKENEDFDAGIDFSSIDLPTGNAGATNAAAASGGAASAASGAKKAGKKSSDGGGTKSSYF